MRRQEMRRRVIEFTDRYPFVGPVIWILSVQYFAVSFLVAAAWPQAYDWAINLISDLGNTACGIYGDRYVCSPLHATMNASFIVLGLTMAIGSLLIYREFEETRGSLIGFSLMGLAGVGTALVGLFPENTVAAMHFLGAILALVVGNISMVVLALSLKKVRSSYRLYTFLSGMFSLVAFVLFSVNQNFGLGQGTVERLAGYPQTLWLIFFGIYMSAVRVRARNRA